MKAIVIFFVLTSITAGLFSHNEAPLEIQVSTDIHTEIYWQQGQKAEWFFDYSYRRPFFLMPISLVFNNVFQAYVELPIHSDPDLLNRKPEKLSNIPEEAYDIELTFPYIAYSKLAFPYWSFSFGRDAIDWNFKHFENFMLSDNPDFIDFARLQADFGFLATDFLYVSIRPEQSLIKEKILPSKTYVVHRFSLQPLPWLTIIINEAMLWANTYMDFRHYNPLMIYHSWFERDFSNSLASLELIVNPLDSLFFYAQLAIDEYQTAAELDEWETADQYPDAYGFSLGIDYSFKYNDIAMNPWLDYSYTNPWMYTYTDDMRLLTTGRYTVGLHRRYREQLLGFSDGPDTVRFRAGTSLNYKDSYAKMFYEYRLKGENTYKTPYTKSTEARIARTPTGDFPESRHTCYLKLQHTLFDRLDISIDMVAQWYKNYQNTDSNWFFHIEFMPALTYTLFSFNM